MKLYLVCILLLVSLNVEAQKTKKQAPAYQPIKGKELISGLRGSLPEMFCKKGDYFRECFKITEADCKSVSQKAYDNCSKRFEDEIPSMIKSEETEVAWGEKLGRCTGEAFARGNVNKAKTDAKCRQASNWVK